MNKMITRSLLAAGLAMVAISGMAENRLYLENFSIKPGEEKAVLLCLDTEQTAINCQFELILPAGLEYGGAELCERSSKCPYVNNQGKERTTSMSVSENETVCRDGVTPCTRVVLTNGQNAPFAGTSGPILELYISANEEYVETSQIELRDVICGHTSQEKLIDYATDFSKSYIKVPLANTAAYDGKEIALDGDLGVAAVAGDKAFVTDGADNWMQVSLGKNTEAMAAITTVADGSIMGVFTNGANPVMTAVEDVAAAEDELTFTLKEYDLAKDLFAPKANEVMNVVGFFQEGGSLTGYSGGTGQSVSLNNAWCAADVPALNVTGQYKFESAVAQLKAPWDAEEAAPGPARVSATDPAAATNVEIYPLVYPSPEVMTAVSDVNTAKAVTSVKYYNAAGQAADKAFEGVNVMVVKYADGTQNISKVVK